jgi:hypothetical protein
MKPSIPSFLLLHTCVALGLTAEPPKPQPATVTNLVLAENRRALTVHYVLSGQAHQRVLTFTNAIHDFRYCRWLGERGLAVVAAGQVGDTTEFYYRALRLDPQETNGLAFKIPAPPGRSQLLGVANTGGDSLVVSAVHHQRLGNQDRLKGWMFIDNCPHIGALGAGLVVPFDVAGELKSP